MPDDQNVSIKKKVSHISQEHPFLIGVAARATKRGLSTDLLGFTSTPILPEYPIGLDKLAFVIAFPDARARSSAKIVFQRMNHAGSFGEVELEPIEYHPDNRDQQFMSETISEHPVELTGNVQPRDMRFIGVDGTGFTTMILGGPQLMIWSPESIELKYIENEKSASMGKVHLGFLESLPISNEERRAILSSPTSPRALTFVADCPNCGSRLSNCELIDPLFDTTTIKDATSTTNLPPVWTCKCGRVKEVTEFLAKSWPYRIRNWRSRKSGLIEARDGYRLQQLVYMLQRFFSLIAGEPEEEVVQRFLQDHSEFWAFLQPKRILHKPKMLSHKAADFGILGFNRVFYIVEIEKPHTPISLSKGGQASELTAGFNQIADWRDVVRKDWHSLLRDLRIKPEEVQVVKYVLVAGLASREDPKSLENRRNNIAADTIFMTFDELGGYLDVLTRILSVQ